MDVERQKMSKLILSKIGRKGVQAVLAEPRDLLSVLLLGADDPAYVAVRKAALEERRRKEQHEEQKRERTRSLGSGRT